MLARHSGVMAASIGIPTDHANGSTLSKTKSKVSLRLNYFHSRSAKSSIRVLIIVGVFLICVGPLLIIAFIFYVNADLLHVTESAGFAVYVVALSHSAINPCVYGLFDKRFREAYRSLFKRQKSPLTCSSHYIRSHYASDIIRMPENTATAGSAHCHPHHSVTWDVRNNNSTSVAGSN
eukprot:sb/3471804/